MPDISQSPLLLYADIAPLTSEAFYAQSLLRLPVPRREKIARLRFAESRRLSLGAWLLLQAGLRVLGLEGADRNISFGDNGKPFFTDLPELHFNLSHSGTKVLCAIADHPVGCDVEEIKPGKLPLAERFFCTEEYEQILLAPNEQARDELFTRLWTLKESYMKASGRGFTLGLKEFCILPGESGVKLLRSSCELPAFLCEFSEGDGYRSALCLQSAPPSAPPKLSCVNLAEFSESI